MLGFADVSPSLRSAASAVSRSSRSRPVRAFGSVQTCRASAPWQGADQLDLECETNQCSHNDDDSEGERTRDRLLDSDGQDEVGDDENLQTQQDSAAESLRASSYTADRTRPGKCSAAFAKDSSAPATSNATPASSKARTMPSMLS